MPPTQPDTAQSAPPPGKFVRFLKALIWFYLSLGVLLILAIVFELFVLPAFSSDGPSPEFLSLLEKILLCWGLILLPFMKVAWVMIMRHQRNQNRA